MLTSSELIRTTALNGFADLVAEFNVSPLDLMHEAGISPRLLDDPDHFIPYRAYCQLMDLAAQTTKTPEFGLLLGDKRNLSNLGLFGVALQQAKSQAEAIEVSRRFLHTHNQCSEYTFQTDNGISQLTHTTKLAQHYPHIQAKLKSMGVANSILKLLHGKDWRPIEVWLDIAPVGDRKKIQRIFAAPVVFNQPESSILFYEQPIADAFFNTEKNSYLQKVVHQYLEKSSQTETGRISDQVTALIKTTLMSGQCSKQSLAELLALHPRTLQRKLAAEGTDFRMLLNKVRKESAQHYLQSTSMSLSEIAEVLGYTDLSAFSRAFKQWCGLSPQAWQRVEKS
ncbi:AraC family transcriptional regulator [Parahaliea maris]|uniref:AraC family transcriptional regulator n=1 Tax=Parahaliea maris TaxID=2716870 RepID=A0A5C8ZYR1_9GAMM|nr:AraC family transcriptional regulator [Parahaliea maris]TXS92949.1 AraC family transcriptional regulator [Parahaliea maris]